MLEFTTKAYFDFIGDGRIMGSRCRACGEVSLPPRPVCRGCASSEMEWEALDGVGAVQAYSIIHAPLSRLEDRCPYVVGVVKLGDGPSISSMILGVSGETGISVGSRVEAEFVDEGEKKALCFRLVR